MCVEHDPKLKKQWLPQKRFTAYKHIRSNNNSSVYSSYEWTVGTHTQKVAPLHNKQTGTGFYVYLDKKSALAELKESRDCGESSKVIAVQVEPEDVKYAGKGFLADDRVLVCKQLTIKSLKTLSKTMGIKHNPEMLKVYVNPEDVVYARTPDNTRTHPWDRVIVVKKKE